MQLTINITFTNIMYHKFGVIFTVFFFSVFLLVFSFKRAQTVHHFNH